MCLRAVSIHPILIHWRLYRLSSRESHPSGSNPIGACAMGSCIFFIFHYGDRIAGIDSLTVSFSRSFSISCIEHVIHVQSGNEWHPHEYDTRRCDIPCEHAIEHNKNAFLRARDPFLLPSTAYSLTGSASPPFLKPTKRHTRRHQLQSLLARSICRPVLTRRRWVSMRFGYIL